MKLAVINTSAPYSNADTRESLDLALVFASFEQAPALFFCGNGVYQLLKQPGNNRAGCQNLNKQFEALTFYDIENIFVCADSLLQRGLSTEMLAITAKALDANEWQQTLAQFQPIMRF